MGLLSVAMLQKLNPFKRKARRVAPAPLGSADTEPKPTAGKALDQKLNACSLPIVLPDAFDLANPDDVFECVDTDNSNALNLHEARFGLNAFGLYPTVEMLTSAFGQRAEISKSEFPGLLTTVKNGKKAAAGRFAVPHARRGLYLAELQALNDAYVTSGWLQEKCDERNTGEPKPRFPYAINLYTIDEFIVRPSTTPDTKTPPANLRAAAGTPDPAWLSSYSELMHPGGVKIDFFVSHFWGHDFQDTMVALTKWAKTKFTAMGKAEARLVTYWICLFAINQHDVAHEVGKTPEEGPFNCALQQAQGCVMIVDEALMPLTRIWCLYEVDRVNGDKKGLELISSKGPLQQLVLDSFSSAKGPVDTKRQAEAREYVQTIGRKLGEISAFSAKSSNPYDQRAILHRIGDPNVTQLPVETLEAWMTDDDGSIDDVDFSEFDSRIQQLLAGPLFNMHCDMGDLEGSLQFLGLGAAFGESHLLTLTKLGCDIADQKVKMRTAGDDWRTETGLLHVAAWYGHVDAIRYLLSLKVNADIREDLNWTPLHYATKSGRIEAMEALLKARANVEAKDSAGDATLHFACLNGRTEAAKLLLKHGASFNKSGEDGWKPIHLAAYGGFTDIVDVLVEQRADVSSKEEQAWTPLHYAAQNGVSKVVSRLLKLRADVTAFGEMGRIPLHLAAGNGHIETARMLLEAGANPNKGDCDEETPLHAATIKEMTSTIKLLLDHKADVSAPNAHGRTPLHSLSTTPIVDYKTSGSDAKKVASAEVLLAARASVDAVDNYQRQPLHLAVEAGAQKLCEFLIANGANVNAMTKRGWTGLHVAASATGFEYAEKEVPLDIDEGNQDEEDEEEKEAGSDDRNDEDDGDEEDGEADEDEDNDADDEEEDEEEEEEEEVVLHPDEATRCAVAKSLLRRKADVSACSCSGMTALHIAADHGQQAIVQVLLEARAPVNAQRNDGRAPLHLAAASGKLNLVDLLMDSGAVVNMTDHMHQLPSQLAGDAGYDEVEKSLLIGEALERGEAML